MGGTYDLKLLRFIPKDIVIELKLVSESNFSMTIVVILCTYSWFYFNILAPPHPLPPYQPPALQDNVVFSVLGSMKWDGEL